MPSSTPTRRGITLMETAMGTLLVGLVISSTLGIVGPVVRSGEHAEREIIGSRLVDELVAEIMATDFEDPDILGGLDMSGGGPDLDTVDELDPLGTEADERSSPRADFDDVDDYAGWIGFPPRDKPGASLGLSGWARQVSVQHVSIINFTDASALRTGAKIIRVDVVYQGTLIKSETFIRTSSWDTLRSP